jgi:hypothetical protein
MLVYPHLAARCVSELSPDHFQDAQHKEAFRALRREQRNGGIHPGSLPEIPGGSSLWARLADACLESQFPLSSKTLKQAERTDRLLRASENASYRLEQGEDPDAIARELRAALDDMPVPADATPDPWAGVPEIPELDPGERPDTVATGLVMGVPGKIAGTLGGASGDRGIGKSMHGMHAFRALAHSAGVPVGLIMAEHSPWETPERCARLGGDWRGITCWDRGALDSVPGRPFNILDPWWTDVVVRNLTARGIRAVLIDSIGQVTSAAGIDLCNDGDAGTVCGVLERIALAIGGPVMFLAHLPKPGANNRGIRWTFGSQVLESRPRTVVHLEEHASRLRVQWVKLHGGADPFAEYFALHTWPLTPADAPDADGEAKAERLGILLDLVRDRPGIGPTEALALVNEAAHGPAVKDRACRSYVRELADRGEIIVHGRGRASKYYPGQSGKAKTVPDSVPDWTQLDA